MLKTKYSVFNNDPNKTPTLENNTTQENNTTLDNGGITPLINQKETTSLTNVKSCLPNLKLNQGSYFGDLSKNKLYQKRMKKKKSS
jgi:hypothetical protein